MNQKNYENCKRVNFAVLSITTFTVIQSEVERADACRTHRGKLHGKFWLENFTKKKKVT
jgi:hypothetical protein